MAASTASFHATQSGPPSGRSRYCFGISLNMPASTDRACSSRPVTRSASCLGRPAIVRLPWVSARCRLDCITAARKIAENRRLAHARGQRFHERSLAQLLDLGVLRMVARHGVDRKRGQHVFIHSESSSPDFPHFLNRTKYAVRKVVLLYREGIIVIVLSTRNGFSARFRDQTDHVVQTSLA